MSISKRNLSTEDAHEPPTKRQRLNRNKTNENVNSDRSNTTPSCSSSHITSDFEYYESYTSINKCLLTVLHFNIPIEIINLISIYASGFVVNCKGIEYKNNNELWNESGIENGKYECVSDQIYELLVNTQNKNNKVFCPLCDDYYNKEKYWCPDCGENFSQFYFDNSDYCEGLLCHSQTDILCGCNYGRTKRYPSGEPFTCFITQQIAMTEIRKECLESHCENTICCDCWDEMAITLRWYVCQNVRLYKTNKGLTIC